MLYIMGQQRAKLDVILIVPLLMPTSPFSQKYRRIRNECVRNNVGIDTKFFFLPRVSLIRSISELRTNFFGFAVSRESCDYSLLSNSTSKTMQ